MANPAFINVTTLPAVVASAIATGQQVTIYDQSGVANRVAIEDVVSAAQGLNGCICVKQASVSLTSAQVLTAFTTPIAFGITVPAGYYANIQSVAFSLTFNSIAYATNTDIIVAGYTGTGLLAAGTTTTAFSIPMTQANANINAGGDAYVTVGTGNPTAGNSAITCYMTYVLVEL